MLLVPLGSSGISSMGLCGYVGQMVLLYLDAYSTPAHWSHQLLFPHPGPCWLFHPQAKSFVSQASCATKHLSSFRRGELFSHSWHVLPSLCLSTQVPRPRPKLQKLQIYSFSECVECVSSLAECVTDPIEGRIRG